MTRYGIILTFPLGQRVSLGRIELPLPAWQANVQPKHFSDMTQTG